MVARILITGGAGYIGSHLCRLLRSTQQEIFVADNLSTGVRDNVGTNPLKIVDLPTQTNFLRSAVEQFEPDVIIHLASLIHIPQSFDQSDLYQQSNAIGTQSVIDVARDTGVKNIVFTSSCTVYGPQPVGPILESTPVNPVSPYGAQKATGESLLNYARDQLDLNIGIVRIFNVSGVQEHIASIGSHARHLLPMLASAAYNNHPFVIYGNDLDTPDGTCIRDYVHVVDVCDALNKLSNYIAQGQSGLFNLGTGIGTSVKEVVSIAQEVMQLPIEIDYKPSRKGDPPALIADIQAAQSQLHWQPTNSDLSRIIREEFETFKRFHVP